MPRTVPEDLAEPIARILKGAIDTGDGGTEEQHSVLQAIAIGFLGRPDLDVETLAPIGPEVAGELITDHGTRRRVREMMVLLERAGTRSPRIRCRWSRPTRSTWAVPTARARAGTRADPRRCGARLADYMRFSDEILEDIAEPSLIAEHMGKDDHAPELAARLRSFHDLPEGTLGRAYVDFCDRNNLTLPGDDPLSRRSSSPTT